MTDRDVAARLADLGLLTADSDALIRGYELPRVTAISALLDREPGATLDVLDVGFSFGLVPVVLRELDTRDRLRLTCTERDAAAVAARRPEAERLLPDVDLVELDLADVPAAGLGTEAFDAIVLGEVVEHLPSPDLPGMLVGLRELLRPHGALIVTTPNLHALSYRARHLLGADFLHDPLPYAGMGLPHVTLLSARVLVDLGRHAGFEAEHVGFHDFTGGMRLRASSGLRRLAVRARRATVSRVAPSTRDDLVLLLRRTDSARPPSPVFARTDVSLAASLRATREAGR